MDNSNDNTKKLVEILIKNKITFSTAESCTAGLLCSTLAEIDGVSSILNESYITYSNESKVRILNVSNKTLENFGAVSEECIKEMLLGLKGITNSDICIAVSGIAGNFGGTKDKPVGTIYYGILIENFSYIYKLSLNGERNENRTNTVKIIIEKLIEILEAYNGKS